MISNKALRFAYMPRILFVVGCLITLVLTFIEVSRGRDSNFQVFADATRSFWCGEVSPYSAQFTAEHGRYFLYTPVFAVLFAPFAFLPHWVGAFAWNIFNYTLFFTARFTLPGQFSCRQKSLMFLFLLPILAQSLFSFQYNPSIASIFLLAYSLLERGKALSGIVAIIVSGVTKIYGLFQIGMLLCYPRFWRNVGWGLLSVAALLALPLLRYPNPADLMACYGEWLQNLASHQSNTIFDSLIYAEPVRQFLLPNFRMVQITTLLLIATLFIVNRKKYDSQAFRPQALGILMSYLILFSDAAEPHTYLIALAGYMLWYHTRTPRPIDKVLMWSNFILLCIVPIDLLFPKTWMLFLHQTLWINIWIFTATWLRMVWITFLRPAEPQLPAIGSYV